MFGQGATPGKVDMWCYHEDEEDFTKGSCRRENLFLSLQCLKVYRCNVSRYMGPGTLTLTIAQCYDGRTSRQAIKGREDGLLPALTWFGYNRSFLPAAFKGT